MVIGIAVKIKTLGIKNEKYNMCRPHHNVHIANEINEQLHNEM